MMTQREKDTEFFYNLLAKLEEQVYGKRKLDDFRTGIAPSFKGVYFFFEPGEYRSNDNGKMRVVRVGTHGTTASSRSTIGTRLFEHKIDGGRSVFRDHINAALRNRARCSEPGYTDDHRHSACISAYIGKMPFLCVKIDSYEQRKFIERNAVALLSNWHGKAVDKPSENWLGKYRVDKCSRLNDRKVKCSGLWNVHYVAWKDYKRRFLNYLDEGIKQTPPIDDGRGDKRCLLITDRTAVL